MNRPKFYTSAPSYNDWLQLGSIKLFYALYREHLKEWISKRPKPNKYDVDRMLCHLIVSIHEHNNHITITKRPHAAAMIPFRKVWRQMGEASHLHIVSANEPHTFADFRQLELKHAKGGAK